MLQGGQPRILVCDPLDASALDLLGQEARVDVQTNLSHDELVEIVSGYDALVVRSGTQVTRDVIAAGSALRAIARAGVGVDNVDLEAATERGIPVVNAPGASMTAVAELTFGLMLALLRELPRANASMKQGRWEKSKFRGHQLRDKTLGVIGYGRIGREVARLGQAFGAKVIATTRSSRPMEYAQRVDLDRLLAESDIISLHTAYRVDSQYLIDSTAFQRMKDGVYIVNTARGPLIDEDALLAALESGKVAGAGLDVFEREPPGASPLVTHRRVICTPHIGAATREAQQEIGQITVRGLLAILRGEHPESVINPQVLPPIGASRVLQDHAKPYDE